MRVRDWAESWGRGAEADPVGAVFFLVRLLRSMVQNEPATDDGVAEGVLAVVEYYGDVSFAVLRLMLDDMGWVADVHVTREFVVRTMEAEG